MTRTMKGRELPVNTDSSIPTRRRAAPEVTEEDKKTILERLAACDVDKKSAVDAR